MLSDKDRELVSIGASMAANCQPCSKFHLRAAQIAGASDAEIQLAVNEAFAVRRHATEGMAQLASQANPLVWKLVSLSAACAINSTLDVEANIAAAQRLGATKGQILSAIKIASAIKATAERKTENATSQAMGTKQGKSANCCNQADEEPATGSKQVAVEEDADTGNCGPECVCHIEGKS